MSQTVISLRIFESVYGVLYVNACTLQRFSFIFFIKLSLTLCIILLARSLTFSCIFVLVLSSVCNFFRFLLHLLQSYIFPPCSDIPRVHGADVSGTNFRKNLRNCVICNCKVRLLSFDYNVLL